MKKSKFSEEQIAYALREVGRRATGRRCLSAAGGQRGDASTSGRRSTATWA